MSEIEILKTVYFVRHGESEHNVAPVFQSPDVPINEKGRSQAVIIADRVASLSFDALISSTYKRARQTAEVIGGVTGKTPEYSELFVETKTPSYIHRKPYEDPKANELWRKWKESMYTPGLRAEDGENYDDVVARADHALRFLHERPEKSIVVVTHGTFLVTIIARVLLGGTLNAGSFKSFQKGMSVKNTGLTVLRYRAGFEEEPSWRLWIFNDHAHLG